MTAKNGVTSFSQLAQALPKVAANANTLGVSIDELMAAFATLTGVSGNTAEVSTQLAAEMGSITSNMWCLYRMHPKSSVFNFWGAAHFSTPTLFLPGWSFIKPKYIGITAANQADWHKHKA